MGMTQTIDTTTASDLERSWSRAAEFLDRTFPLAEGSHRDAVDYVLMQEHLLVIGRDGRCTGLARPGQFVEAGGNAEEPCPIVLEADGLQVEIEPCSRRRAAAGKCTEHGLRLVAELAAA